MASKINYDPDIGFYDDKTKAAMPVTAEALQVFAKTIEKGYAGKPGKITVCVGVVQQGGQQMLVYTVSQNYTSPGIKKAADQLGITRWEQRPRVKGRGPVGAPGDAEQIMFEAADVNTFRVLAVAPSNHACADCAVAIARRGVFYYPPIARSSKTPEPPRNKQEEEPGKKGQGAATPKEEPAKKSKSKTPTNGTEENKITDENRGIKPKVPPAVAEAEPPKTKATATSSTGTGANNSATSQKAVPDSVPASVKSRVEILSKIKTITTNITPSLRKLLSFYSALDTILSSFEQIQGAIHLLVNGREKSAPETAADNMYQSATEVHDYSQQLWSNINDSGFDKMIQDGMNTTDELEILQFDGSITDIKQRPQEVLDQLQDFNKKYEPIEKEVEFLIPKLTYLLENPTGSVLLTIVSEFQQHALTRMPVVRLLMSAFGVENYSVNTLQVSNLREMLYHVRGPLSQTLTVNQESMNILKNIIARVDYYDKKIMERQAYIRTHYTYYGKGWAISE